MKQGRFLAVLAGLAVTNYAAGAENTAWTDTLERISSGVVSIRVDSTRAFDTEWNSSSQATGFVVDAKRGLILTNRHVVTPGPVVAEAIFLNNEEVRLTPVYRDPVHDFGFFRYDPADLNCSWYPMAPALAGRSASSAMMRVNNCRFWLARSRGSTARRQTMVAASTTISIHSITRQRRELPAARPDLLSSTSTERLSRSMRVRTALQRAASFYRWIVFTGYLN